MSNETKIIGLIAGLTILIFVGIIAFSSRTTPASTEPIKVDQAELIRSDSLSIGPANAQVTVVEFTDFQCPACQAAYPILKQVIEAHPQAIRFVHRHYPLVSIHPNAEAAALVSEAAAIQGKFWQMHDLLFTRHDEWAELSDPQLFFQKYAEELKLNIDQFKKDRNSPAAAKRIAQDRGDGEALKVDSTPTIYINGQKYSGQLNGELAQAIESQLK